MGRISKILKSNLFEIIGHLTIIFAFIVATIFGILNFVNDDNKILFITLVSSFLGGTFTFLGVFLTLKHNDENEEDKYFNSCKPEFYISNKFDTATATEIKIVSKETGNIPCNHVLHLKNTDKNHFVILKAIIDEIDYFPSSPSFVGKDDCICLKYYLKGNPRSMLIVVQCRNNIKLKYQVFYDGTYITLGKSEQYDNN